MIFLTCGLVEKAAFEFLDMAAEPIFALFSNALPKSFITLVANFLPALAKLPTKFRGRLPSPSAGFVLSQKVIVCFSVTTNTFTKKNFDRF